MPIGKLTAAKVKTAKPGKLCDGGGLWLYIGSNSKSWVFRYMINGRSREMGLGSTDTLTLAAAREAARLSRVRVHRKPEDGGPIDPLDERQAAEIAQAQARRVEKAKAMSFKDCADGYLRANVDSWKNSKHRQQWFNTLNQYVHPIIGDLPVQRVDESGIVKVLMPIWYEKAETARRVRMRIETIIEWAIASKFYVGDNPAKRERLKHLLGAQTDVVKHHEAMHYAKIGDFMTELRRFDSIGALPLEFCVLTATRTGEILGADWSEIDRSTKTWTIPGVRRKGKKGKEVPLTVPLSRRCIEILDQIAERTGEVGLIFPNPNGDRLSENTLNDTLTQMGHEETTHGMRSSFRDWGGDCTNFPRDLVEMALGHKVGDEVEQAYRRSSAIEKRRKLMEAWARYCDTASVEKGEVVVAIGAARHG
jgi:integrase